MNKNTNSDNKHWWSWFNGLSLIILSIILIVVFVMFNNKIPGTNYIREKISWNLALGYSISVLWGSSVIRVVLKILKYKIDSHDGKLGKFTLLIGPLEAFAFTTAWAFNYPSFIALWIGVKMAGRWGNKENNHKKGEINIFLIGNLLNICFSVIAGQIIKKGL